MRIVTILTAIAVTQFAGVQAGEPAFTIEQVKLFESSGDYEYSQCRGTAFPDGRILLTAQEIERKGAHGYRDLFQFESCDAGQTWSKPRRMEPLRRGVINAATKDERVVGDLCPRYHANTGKVLGTGKTFTFRGGTKEDRSAEEVSYAVYDPQSDAWSGLKIVEMPKADHEGKPILQPNAGCNDRVDLPKGDILLPIRYGKDAKKRCYTTIVARCRFDGQTLTYVEHGSELSRDKNRGLYEPSLHALGGKFYLTMRADDTAFVSVSSDGLNYSEPKEWTYDDGQVLGSYNTQQHWASHACRLYLVYTRRGAGNDHIFRHRAPLFIAEVDPVRLCVLRATEQIALPHNHADIGNFDVIPVSEKETWIVAAESLVHGKRNGENNGVLAARVAWK
ncbi:MAG: exo-alpha-sialidase [Planctomycetaceae bacterium]|nr:exo-alpha-sialidase [Planctomycetaceae bacterium]